MKGKLRFFGWIPLAAIGVVSACSSDQTGGTSANGGQGGSAGSSGASAGSSGASAGSSGASAGSSGNGTAGSAGSSAGSGGDAGNTGTSGAAGAGAGGEAGAPGCADGFTGPNCDLPRFETLSGNITALSSDGSTVIGSGTTGIAFRYTHASGMSALAPADPRVGSTASALSADGTIVVGASTDASATPLATRWDASGAPSSLGALTGDDTSQALLISQDGAIVLGWSRLSTGSRHAFVWSQAQGVTRIGATVTVDLVPVASSADGKVAALQATTTPSGTAYLWSNRGATASFQALPALNGDVGTVVEALSGDGDVAVGYSVASDMSHREVRWVSGGAAQLLDSGWACNGPISPCVMTNLDGSVIFGERGGYAVRWTAADGVVQYGRTASAFGCAVFVSELGSSSNTGVCFGPPVPVQWSDTQTPAPLADALTALGVDSKGYLVAPSLVRGISASGKVVAGYAFSTTSGSWIARLD